MMTVQYRQLLTGVSRKRRQKRGGIVFSIGLKRQKKSAKNAYYPRSGHMFSCDFLYNSIFWQQFSLICTKSFLRIVFKEEFANAS